MDELVRLSILLGRSTGMSNLYSGACLLEQVTSPPGITFAMDEALHGLLSDLKRWKEALPGHLKFRGAVKSSLTAGMQEIIYLRSNQLIAARPSASVVLFTCLHGVLEGIHEDQLLLSSSPHICHECQARDRAGQPHI